MIQKGAKEPEKLFQGMCLLLEVYEATPEALTPLEKVIVKSIVKPLVAKTEKSLGVEL